MFNSTCRSTQHVGPSLTLNDLFQAGPLEKVKIPCDRDGSNKKSFGFVTFKHSVSVPYTIQLMEGMRLFGRVLRLQNRSGSRPSTPVEQRPPPHRSLSAPFPQRDMTPMANQDFGRPNAAKDFLTGSPLGLMGPDQATAVMNQLMTMAPLSLPSRIGQNPDPNRNSPSFGQYESQQGSSRGYNDQRGRHERRNSDRASHRYDPRNSWDRGGRDRDSGGWDRDREGPRRHNSLQSHTNFNPRQKHMDPSPRRGRRHWIG